MQLLEPLLPPPLEEPPELVPFEEEPPLDVPPLDDPPLEEPPLVELPLLVLPVDPLELLTGRQWPLTAQDVPVPHWTLPSLQLATHTPEELQTSEEPPFGLQAAS